MIPNDLKDRVQRNLVDFLRIDTDIAFTFLDTAAIDVETNPPHAKMALDKARTALDTIRHLLARVEDPAEHAEINSRADQLAAAISKFPA